MFCRGHIRRLGNETFPLTAVTSILVRVLILVLLIAAVGLLAPAPNVKALTLRPLTVDEMARVADSILLTRTTAIDPRQITLGSGRDSAITIQSVVCVDVLEVLKGAAGLDRILVTPGGDLGTIRATVDYAPTFALGETSILFLDDLGRVIGGPQGKLAVINGRIPALDASVTDAMTSIAAAIRGAFSSPSGTVPDIRTPASQPVITNISPASGSGGTDTQVTISGTGFGYTQGAGEVSFYCDEQYVINPAILSWTDTAIRCNVPTATDPDGYPLSAGSGPVYVTNSSGWTSNSYEFHVTFAYGDERWPSPSAGYRVNSTNAATSSGHSMVDAAARTWSAASSFNFVDAGSCSTTNFYSDGHNDIFWSPYLLPYGVLAGTSTVQSGSTIIECDVCFNDASYNIWGDGAGGTLDIETIALHELGHWLKLGDLYGPGDAGKVMYGFGEPGERRRSLNEDDAAGIRWIYGGGPITTTTTPRATTTTTLPHATTTTLPPTTTTTLSQGGQFRDVGPTHPYRNQIADLASKGIVGGFSDGTFRPDGWVTRQQFAKMVVKTLGYPVGQQDLCPFLDVGNNMDPADGLYPDHYVAVCAARGITTGKRPGEFAPYDNMTRAQLITMVARAANLPEPPADYLPPIPVFDSVHYPFARRAAYGGVLRGLVGVGPTYGFVESATRGEVCVLLYNLLNR